VSGDILRVLLVEDDPNDAELLLEYLGDAGFDPAHRRVVTAEEVSAALADATWDVVLCDAHLPRIGFADVLAIVRAAAADLPVLIVSGHLDEEDAVVAMKAGAQDLVLKNRLGRLGPAIRREIAEAASRRARRAAEEALRASEDLFRQIADTIDDVLWIVDVEGKRLRYVSPAFERVWGSPREPVERVSALWADSIHPEDKARVVKASSEDDVHGRYDQTYRIVRPDGTVRWVRDRAFPIRDATGAVVRVIGVAHDVTAAREIDDALRRSEEQLRHAQRMEAVGRLAGGVAHDFNNMLTVIEGYGAMALERLRPDDQLFGWIEEIQRAAQRAAVMTHRLLAFSRKQVLQPQVLDVNEVLRGMDELLRRLLGADVNLVTVPREGIGRIRADPGQIEQVIANLAVNARDAMPHGGTLALETFDADLDADYARSHPEVTPGPYVCLAVSDTGTGMDEHVRQHLFEPFFTTKEPGKGTGLGLSTVYGIVRQSAGHVAVYTELGRGTSFKVYLPRVDEEPTHRTPVVRDARSHDGTETVLVAEDEDAVRALVRDVLTEHGYHVIEARTGRDALAALKDARRPVDLVLTDVIMPGMSGPHLVKRITDLVGSPRVIYMSGHTDTALVAEGGIDPQVPYLQKPFTGDTLLQRVREVLDAPRRRE
jgi:PAS domain S-box-containing protein